MSTIINIQIIKPLKHQRISTKNPRIFEELKEHSKDLNNLKNGKSLTSSKLDIHCKDRSIHLPIKVKKISSSSQDRKEFKIRGALFSKRVKIEKLYSPFD